MKVKGKIIIYLC